MNKKIFYLILLYSLFEQIQMEMNQFKYHSKKNIFIDLNFNKVFMLDGFKVFGELFCLSKCNKVDTCVSCAYSRDEIAGLNCFLYNRRIETLGTGTMRLFNKLCPNGEMQSFDTQCFSLKELFYNGLSQNQLIQNSHLMNLPMELFIAPYIPHNYYVNNYMSNNIMIFDRNWNFLSYFNTTYPRDIRIINNFTYILAVDGLRKFDYNMQVVNFVANINPCFFLRMHYSEIYNTLYVTNNCVFKIDLFDLNLTYTGNISLNNQKSFSFKEFDGKLYATTQNRTIFVIQNRTIIGNYTNICTSVGELRGLCIDYEGYMAVTCTNDHSVFLYHINGTNMNKSYYSSSSILYWAKFDLNGNLAVSDTTLNKIFLLN